MRIATWNVNSIRQRLDPLLVWLKDCAPDIVCLQEIKCVDEAFPREPIEALGTSGRIAETAGGLDGLGGGVVLARESEHRAGEDQAGRLRGLGHGVPFGPARVVGVAAGNLGRFDSQVDEQAL